MLHLMLSKMQGAAEDLLLRVYFATWEVVNTQSIAHIFDVLLRYHPVVQDAKAKEVKEKSGSDAAEKKAKAAQEAQLKKQELQRKKEEEKAERQAAAAEAKAAKEKEKLRRQRRGPGMAIVEGRAVSSDLSASNMYVHPPH
jgi:lysine/ornithine N-monooxygenase